MQAKKASPEQATAQAVLAHKRSQKAQLEAQLRERQRQGLVKVNKQGQASRGCVQGGGVGRRRCERAAGQWAGCGMGMAGG